MRPCKKTCAQQIWPGFVSGSKKIVLVVISIFCSALLIFSVTIANLFVKGGIFKERTYTVTEVKTVTPDRIQEQPKEKKMPRKAQRQKTNSRSPKAGPRFAMELGTISGGNGGAVISSDFVTTVAGGGNLNQDGDVDEKPESRSYPAFQPPQGIRESETDAVLRLSFCVDISGKVYNIKTVEETLQVRDLPRQVVKPYPA
jgi:protein TonB